MEFSKRKWGWYLTLYSAECFKIKLLYFKKKSKLSLQRHFKRYEYWLILSGNGRIHNDSRIEDCKSRYEILRKGEYKNITIGNWHQFKSNTPTFVLEIQTGECREDDIERAS